jgi:hypothetical protein
MKLLRKFAVLAFLLGSVFYVKSVQAQTPCQNACIAALNSCLAEAQTQAQKQICVTTSVTCMRDCPV